MVVPPLNVSPAPSLKAAQESARPSQEFAFSVVTAAYNCAPWIEKMLSSLEQQELDFATHIQLIVVDDGSLDETADIILRWVQRYPGNITLLRKENGGVATARNLGLAAASGRWVTFIDADDFVSERYFSVAKDFLDSGFDGAMLAGRLVYYAEDSNTLNDSHPLGYKFSSDVRVADLMVEPECIQLATNFFVERERLAQSGIVFDERIKPSFEDGNFLNRYLLSCKNYKIAFLKNALYFYRKRSGSDSLVDQGWSRGEKYQDQILYGYLGLLRTYQSELGYVPLFVQNTVLYDVYWYVRKMLDNVISHAFPGDALERFFDLLRTVFRFIEADTILSSGLPMMPLMVRLAMLSTLKDVDLGGFPLVVHEVSADRREFSVACYGGAAAQVTAQTEQGQVQPRWSKVMHHSFRGQDLLVETRLWFPLADTGTLQFMVNGHPVSVLCAGRMFEQVGSREILGAWYAPLESLPPKLRKTMDEAAAPAKTERYAGCWLFMDRIHKADDNAEHLYQWMQQYAPDIKIHFVLSRRSPDWQRLAAKGFALLAHDSKEHHYALLHAAWLISSQIDPPVVDPLGLREVAGIPGHKLAFLQHGIITQNLSRWLNQKRMDLFVTSTQPEFDSIVQGEDYKFTPREVVLTGLPRHDALLQGAADKKPGKVILFCPTWRMHLRKSLAHVPGLPDLEGKAFADSCYFKAWNAVTGSEELAAMAARHGYRLLFMPHPEVSRFLPLFANAGAFTFLGSEDFRSIQDILLSSRMIVTDYSSLAIEAAYVGKAVMHYQFPERQPFFSGHVYTEGYFDYARDGFGPRACELPELLAHLDGAMAAGCVRAEPYETRARGFFTQRDGNCCQRVYEAILARS
ncbi:MAG: CDP-glycerol:glycerophosphate glycerophosphotransferase [Proteobacteria bacterium]|nr:CDP-glycerol:glycerophosphate glycerophosphotransferase [Pseudomonadota bacterium]